MACGCDVDGWNLLADTWFGTTLFNGNVVGWIIW